MKPILMNEIPYESENTELKQSFDNDIIAKEIVAFLNTFDGKIYLGISNSREVVGITPNNDKDKLDEILRKVSDIVTDQISPRCIEYVSIKHLIISYRDIIEIDIKKGKEFYYHKKCGMSEKGCFIREGTSVKPLLPNEIKRRYEATLNIQRPSIIEIESRNQKLTFMVLKIFLDEHRISYEQSSFAETFNLLNKNNKYNEMAYLLSDQFNESIKVCRFEKDGRLTLRQEFGKGCLFKVYYDLKDYIINQVNIPKTYFDHGQRRDEYPFDEIAFVEAWKNAILHNDYSIRQYPQIYLYYNRIEIMSHGNALKNDTLDEFLRGISKPINLELSKIAINLDITDQTGKGNKDIVRTYGKEIFDILDNTLIVKIPLNPLAIPDVDDTVNDSANVTVNVTENVTEKERKILEIISTNPFVTTTQIASLMKLSRMTISRVINKLKKKNVVKRVEGDKTGYWVLNNEQEDTPVAERSEKKCANNVGQNVGQYVGQYVGQSAEETKDQELELKIRDCISKNNRISKRQIALLAGVSEKTIERLMKKLPNIKYIGHGKGGHWII